MKERYEYEKTKDGARVLVFGQGDNGSDDLIESYFVQPIELREGATLRVIHLPFGNCRIEVGEDSESALAAVRAHREGVVSTVGIYTIPDARYADFTHSFERATKQAQKVGCALPTVDVLGTTLMSWYSFKMHRTLHALARVVRVTGSRPKFEGWRFVARIETVVAAEGDTPPKSYVYTAPGELVPAEQRTRGNWCDHCATKRNRVSTFILRHDDGRYASVGSTCLSDFLGGMDPQRIALYAQFMEVLDTSAGTEDFDLDAAGCGARGALVEDTEVVIRAAIAAVDEFGWISTKDFRTSTRDRVSTFIWGLATSDQEKEVHAKLTLRAESEAVRREALAAIEWAKNLPAHEVHRSDYLFNLHTSVDTGIVTQRALGIVVSLVTAYRRALELDIKRAKGRESLQGSQFVGTVKERREFTATLIWLREIQGQYGTTTLFKFLTDDGNVLVWFASGSADRPQLKVLEQGSKYNFRGTIKVHETRDEVKQTGITRVVDIVKVEQVGANS